MNIAVITSGAHPMPPVEGGAVQTLVSLYLDENEKNGIHQFTVFGCDNSEAKKIAMTYKHSKFCYINTKSPIYTIKKSIRYILNRFTNNNMPNEYIHRIIKKLKNETFDIIVIEGHPLLGMHIPVCNGTKKILHLHNDQLNIETVNAREILHVYDAVLSNSQFVASKVKEIDNDFNKVFVLDNAIDLKKFSNTIVDENRWRTEYRIPSDKLIILYTGRINRNKGVKELVEAFLCSKILKEKTVLILAGGVDYGKNGHSSYLDDILSLINEEPSVIYTGFINPDKLLGLYSMADIGVVPSIWDEPFGLTVIEHMISKNALVVTDSGEIPNIVRDGCALIVKRHDNLIPELTNSLEKLVNNKEVRECLVESSTLRVQNYDSMSYCSKFFEILYRIKEEI